MRYVTDGNAFTSNFQGFGSRWLRLVRAGDQVMGYFSADGVTWSLAFNVTIPMAGCVEVGLFAEGTNPVSTVTATFDHVAIDSPSGPALPKIVNTASTQTASALDPVGMELWPNPASGQVMLRFSDQRQSSDLVEIEVIDGFGKSVLTRLADPGQTTNLDLNHCSPGGYIVRVLSAGGRSTVQRLVVSGR